MHSQTVYVPIYLKDFFMSNIQGHPKSDQIVAPRWSLKQQQQQNKTHTHTYTHTHTIVLYT